MCVKYREQAKGQEKYELYIDQKGWLMTSADHVIVKSNSVWSIPYTLGYVWKEGTKKQYSKMLMLPVQSKINDIGLKAFLINDTIFLEFEQPKILWKLITE